MKVPASAWSMIREPPLRIRTLALGDLLHLLLHLEVVEDGLLVAIELHPPAQLGGDALEILDDLPIQVSRVDDQPVDVVREEVPDHAGRSCPAPGARGQGPPRAWPSSACAGGRAGALSGPAGSLFPAGPRPSVRTITENPSGSCPRTTSRSRRRSFQLLILRETPTQSPLGMSTTKRPARASCVVMRAPLVADRFLRDLHQQLLALLDEVLDRWILARTPAVPAAALLPPRSPLPPGPAPAGRRCAPVRCRQRRPAGSEGRRSPFPCRCRPPCAPTPAVRPRPRPARPLRRWRCATREFPG